ncbi:MAG: Na+/H+ antiporter NhaA [Ignavibacteriae bacterium HGW-Ignavibacteriae-3]|nr:MAG: Na+/H+ antiporter NhaA [Ignavibacteriae bacterium HGW-Ignavibacteriae-3]
MLNGKIKLKGKIQLKVPIQEFFESASASGILLMMMAILALIIANSPISKYYFELLETHITIGVPYITLDKSLLHWINDGLMALFFLLVGMEIKRELVMGVLSDFKSAMLPIIAAFGGAVVPAIIYLILNSGTPYERGWGIPMATDIAFAVGVLMLLGSRIPMWAKIFLTALAVADDLMAVLIIAAFYTSEISMTALEIAAVAVLVLAFLNWKNINSIAIYILVGIVLWLAILKSGIHATIAGVILGILIPVKNTLDKKELINNAQKGVSLLREHFNDEKNESSGLKVSALNYLGDVVKNSESPLLRLEHKLQPWVAFLVVPLFAFANSGLILNVDTISVAFSSTLSWGIILGLFFGKQLGIFLPSVLILKYGNIDVKFNKQNVIIFYGLSILGGIGFTMSLFISGLAFDNPAFLENAKIGIIAVSLFNGLLGYFVLKYFVKE